MKNLFLICFLIIGFWSFGQGCGCQEGVHTTHFGKAFELENPQDYFKDSVYINFRTFEENPSFNELYLINTSDSTFKDRTEKFFYNAKIMIEAIDSFGNWQNLIYHKTPVYCYHGTRELELNKSHYTSAYVSHIRNQGNFKTQVRFRLDFENHQFYSEPFTDSIQYCQFINCYHLLSDYLEGKSSNYHYLLFQKENAAIINILNEEQYLLRSLSTLNEDQKIERFYQLLKFHDIEFKYRSRLEQSVFMNRLRNDSTCLEIYGDTLSRYIQFWYSIEVIEKTLQLQIEENNNLTEINRSKQNLEKLNKFLPNRDNIFTPNNERHFIQKGDEYFIKVGCLENYLVKVRVKSD